MRHFCIQLKCKICSFLYHAKCVNFDRKNLEQINDPWYCKTCIESNLPFCCIEEEADFHDAIAEMFLTSKSIYSDIDKVIFNPFEINEEFETPLTDVDPDYQFYVDSQYIQSTKCDYYIEDKFKSRISTYEVLKKCFSLMHMNVRSLPKHIDELELYLESLDYKFSIIGLSETRLDDSKQDLYNLHNYTPIHFEKEELGVGFQCLSRIMRSSNKGVICNISIPRWSQYT